MENLTIGQVAAEAGVNKETIRYYQRLGLVAQPVRPPGSVRRYGAGTIARLRFIKRAQELGFTLEEVKSLLTLEEAQDCRTTRLLAERKLAIIEERMAGLERMRRSLAALVGECRRGKRPRRCPIIGSLAGGA